MNEKAAVKVREKWVDDVKVIPCKIHNADFSDAYVVCGTNEISLTEVGYRKFCDSCGAGTRN